MVVEINTTINEVFNLLFVSLDNEKAEILINRYLNNKTLQEIAYSKGITRERVRQIEAKSVANFYEFLKFRGYKSDLDLIIKKAASKLFNIKTTEFNIDNLSYNDKYLFILKISTKFPESTSKIESHRYFKNDLFMNVDLKIEDLIKDFKELYRTDKESIISKLNIKHQLNLDESFLSNFINLNQLDSSESENLFEFKIREFEENRLEKIEKFFRNREREATIQEIVDETGLSERQVRSAIDNTDKIVNIGKSVYGHIENGYKQGTTEDLILEFVKLNSPVSLFKIQRYIRKERSIQDSTITATIGILTKKKNIKYLDGEYQFVSDQVTFIDKSRKNKEPISKDSFFKELYRLNLTDKKNIVISELNDSIWIAEFIVSEKYTGPSMHGVGVKKSEINLFIEKIQDTIEYGTENRMPWKENAKAELVIAKHEDKKNPEKFYYDLRQFIRNREYESFTRKGIRMSEENFTKFFNEFKSIKDRLV